MRAAFADAFYYLALLSPTDSAHGRALALSVDFFGRTVTTAWVLTEVGDALAAPAERRVFLDLVARLRSDPSMVIVPPTQDLFDRGLELYSERPDKHWSLTDCISFVVMKQHGITDALTGDRHFEQAGFTALLK